MLTIVIKDRKEQKRKHLRKHLYPQTYAMHPIKNKNTLQFWTTAKQMQSGKSIQPSQNSKFGRVAPLILQWLSNEERPMVNGTQALKIQRNIKKIL